MVVAVRLPDRIFIPRLPTNRDAKTLPSGLKQILIGSYYGPAFPSFRLLPHFLCPHPPFHFLFIRGDHINTAQMQFRSHLYLGKLIRPVFSSLPCPTPNICTLGCHVIIRDFFCITTYSPILSRVKPCTTLTSHADTSVLPRR